MALPVHRGYEQFRERMTISASTSVGPAIQMWPFERAPLQYRRETGGDEDWVVVIPAVYARDANLYMPWLEIIDSGRKPNRYDLPNGDVLYVGTHA
jgi:hypothetical protein